MTREEIYEGLKNHYETTGRMMSEQEFINFIQDKVSVSEAIDAIMEFNRFLDSKRK
ncbi:hypothetical protein [Fictibacillus sp. JL2B1089]|uniref:hypothetical protein n=1 Tax=Fictibacillus sp. JL2B1089 TaxID=3399565 RepID=UPI003A8995AD